MTPSDEQQLWKNFQQGDENALSTIYSIYFDHLYNYGFKFTHDTALVEDCIQELFIKLIRTRQNLSVPDSVKNYLFKALRSHIFDKIAQLERYSSREIDDSVRFDLQPNRESELIDEEDAKEKHKKLQAALKELTPRQREAIFLKYEEGFSYAEIAGILSLTQKAAYKLIGRAIQTLRAADTSAGLIAAGYFLAAIS